MEVWRRPFFSVVGTRCTRCWPASRSKMVGNHQYHNAPLSGDGGGGVTTDGGGEFVGKRCRVVATFAGVDFEP